ncbi:MAG: 50S ribosomal protein L11 methyltransferase [Gammaproteobacteria bacterium]|nr:50S ribosomal protein L11 methyltransferase [Gammaproteobacteria bacterium]
MPWQQLVVELGDLDHEIVESCVDELGAVSISLQDAGDQPLLEPAPGSTPLWSQMRLLALFAADIDRDAVDLQLQKLGAQDTHWERLEDRQWERVWMDDFRPMEFGSGLWVCPHGQTIPDARCVLHLDPGLAFGTGRHATTALCLQWLSQAKVADQLVLDYGCGSGILGLAAARLGASRVYAVDIDEQALIATRDNAASNQVETQLIVSLPEDYPMAPVDIALANILAGPLVSLAPVLAAAVRTGGSVVLSGILDDQANQVRQAYTPWFEMHQPIVQAGWARLNGIRNTRVHTVS